MATIKISELKRFTEVESGDFAIIINTGTRTPKKIAITDLVNLNGGTIFSRFKFNKENLNDCTGTISASGQTGDSLESFVYSTPTTIRFTGFTGAANTGFNTTYTLSGIQNDHLAWSSGDFSITRSGSGTYWNLNSGSSGFFQFSSGLTYPNFGPIFNSNSGDRNLLDGTGGTGVTESGLVSLHSKTGDTPIFFSNISDPVTGVFQSDINLPILDAESANINFLYNTGFFPSTGSIDLNFNQGTTVVSSGQSVPVTSISGSGKSQTIFTVEVTGFTINQIVESGSGNLGNFSFNNNFNQDFEMANTSVVTGIVVNDSVDLQSTKPQVKYRSLDIDNDGLASTGDMTLLKRYLAGTTGSGLVSGIFFNTGTTGEITGLRSGFSGIQSFIQSGIDLNGYDVNEDGSVGSDDFTLIFNFASGSGVPVTGRNGMRPIQLQSNMQAMFNV